MKFFTSPILLLLWAFLATGCSTEKKAPFFNKLTNEHTGISFSNDISTPDGLNVQDNPFLYNGGGVAVGDVSGDGLPDLYFTGNQVSSRLYINKGNMEFEDVTESAGVSTNRWATGASMVDINGDGLLDIYVSAAGHSHTPAEQRANLLFINNGDETFTESAATYNLDNTKFTTQAAFLDYDGDEDLDVFLLNNSPVDFARTDESSQAAVPESERTLSFDNLYQNNGDGSFSDVSREAGILEQKGYGLGIAVSDINRDGSPDVYISNDLQTNSVLYINNGDGTFTDQADSWLKHTSYAGMGTDIADFNNDSWPDILQTDMMPEDLRERKRMSGSITYKHQREMISKGYNYQYSLNTLQLSNGIKPNGDLVFSEIARQAGVAYTQWGWAGLFADFNNNGLKDILVTNGYPKAVNDFDYKIDWYRLLRRQNQTGRPADPEPLLRDLHSIEIPNYLFKNNGNLGFTDKTKAWGLDEAGYSYGAAYADLNNNGRLDLVINNINNPASIYENSGNPEHANNYLKVSLSGEAPNSQGIGAEIVLTAGGQNQYVYHSPYRGYQSTVDQRIHFGLNDISQVDSLEVFWPDGRYQLLTNVNTNQLVTIEQQHAGGSREKRESNHTSHKLFQQLGNEQTISWEHQENESFNDFGVQPQLPHQLSRLGPALATDDVTGNGLADVYVGGASGSAGALFLQQEDGQFIKSPLQQPWEADRDHEDTGALFFDANGDGSLDLYVASGGYETSAGSQRLQDRLYINEGDGQFEKRNHALPQMLTSSKAVAAGDFTGDGLLDLFVGGRLVPGNYPSSPRSYLLQNNGGTFSDITESAAPDLLEPGMITDAVWVDYNGDGRSDLVTTGIWLPVQFYENQDAQLQNSTSETDLPSLRGWWYSIAAGDFNKDGDMDLVAGNLGLNHTFTTTPDNPFGLYAPDFNGNGRMGLFFTKRKNTFEDTAEDSQDNSSYFFSSEEETDGYPYPFFGLAKYGIQYPQFMRRYQSFEKFSDLDMAELFSSSTLENTTHYQVDTFASVYLTNNGDGTYSHSELPYRAQISPVKSILSYDLDQDGHLDILIAGNIYATDPEIPRADAGNGLWLRGDGTGEFTAVSPFESGFLAPKDVKALELVQNPNGYSVIVGNNNDSLDVFGIRP